MGFSHARPNVDKVAEVLGVDKQVLEDALRKYTFGGFARVWAAKDEGNYSTVSMSISKKNKETNAYDIEFQDGYVRFVGRAHNLIKQAGLPTPEQRKSGNTGNGISIKILNADVTNYYKPPEGKASYTPRYVVFDIEFPDAPNANGAMTKKASNTNSTKDYSGGEDGFMNVPDGVDEELPFD